MPHSFKLKMITVASIFFVSKVTSAQTFTIDSATLPLTDQSAVTGAASEDFNELENQFQNSTPADLRSISKLHHGLYSSICVSRSGQQTSHYTFIGRIRSERNDQDFYISPRSVLQSGVIGEIYAQDLLKSRQSTSLSSQLSFLPSYGRKVIYNPNSVTSVRVVTNLKIWNAYWGFMNSYGSPFLRLGQKVYPFLKYESDPLNSIETRLTLDETNQLTFEKTSTTRAFKVGDKYEFLSLLHSGGGSAYCITSQLKRSFYENQSALSVPATKIAGEIKNLLSLESVSIQDGTFIGTKANGEMLIGFDNFWSASPFNPQDDIHFRCSTSNLDLTKCESTAEKLSSGGFAINTISPPKGEKWIGAKWLVQLQRPHVFKNDGWELIAQTNRSLYRINIDQKKHYCARD